MALEQEVYLSIPEAARYVGVSRVTLWRWCNDPRHGIPMRRYASGTEVVAQIILETLRGTVLCLTMLYTKPLFRNSNRLGPDFLEDSL